MRKFRILVMLVLVAALAVPLVRTNAQGGDNILAVAEKAGTFKTLAAAVGAAGLADTLNGAGPFTVFAPTDEAFAKVPAYVLEYLLKPEQKDLLTRILTYHVVSGEVMSKDVVTMDGKAAKSVEGGDIAISVKGDKVKVNAANVTTVDVKASNGVIHVIDSVILPAISLPEVDPLTVSGNILTAGSSTVFPLTRAIADSFRAAGFADNIEVASVGTGAGFERFCKAGETDIANASRAIKSSEVEDCKKINRDPVGFFVGVDALAIVVGKNTAYVDNLTTEQIQGVFSGKFKKWNEVNAAWPADDIKVFSPGTDSGTFDYFVEHFFAKDKNMILNTAGIQLSEDDNVLVQGVSGSKGAIGYFGYAYFLPNADKLNAISVDGVAPSGPTAESGEYSVARPLFIYTTAAIMKDKPQVAAFVNYYLQNFPSVLGIGEGKVAYFLPNGDAINLGKLEFLAAQ
jgi:phosphate binding protein